MYSKKCKFFACLIASILFSVSTGVRANALMQDTASGGGDTFIEVTDEQELSSNTFAATGNNTASAVFSNSYGTELTGTCGYNVFWALTDDGVLHIYGTGKMKDYRDYGSDRAPWYPYREKITVCAIEDGVTSIGGCALYDCSSLKGIAIPGSVKRIEMNAFCNCNMLSDVYYIGTEDQWGAINISWNNAPLSNAARHDVEFADDVCTITVLPPENGSVTTDKTLTLKNETITLTAQPETGYQLESFVVDGQEISGNTFKTTGNHTVSAVFSKPYNTELSGACGDGVSWALTDDGVLHIYGTGQMSDYSIVGSQPWNQYQKNITRCEIEDGVTYIGKCAFMMHESLKSTTISSTVTSIAYGAFYGCSSLNIIIIPSSVTSIGDEAFYGCALTDICYIGTQEQWNAISIGSNNYLPSRPRHYAASVDDIFAITVVPAEHGKVTSAAVAVKGEIASITVKPEAGYKVDMIIVDGQEITGNTFTVTGNHTVSAVFSKPYDTERVGKCGDILSWALTNDGVLHIFGTGTMYDYTSDNHASWYQYQADITACEIEDGVTSIGNYALYGCTSLERITIPDSVTSIGERGLLNCNFLESITIPGSVTSIGDFAFCDCKSLKEITLSDGVISIGNYVFRTCTALTSITIPESVTSLGNGVFKSCSKLQLVTIPDSVTSIGSYAFCECTSLTSITIPDSVTSIDNDVFNSCRSLESITIPDSVTSIGDSAFEFCTALTSITIPDGVTVIYSDAFRYCTQLRSVTIPDSVTFIGSCAFEHCELLRSITIPDSVTGIAGSTFKSCKSLTSITIPDGVTSIGSYAFNYCTSLTSIIIPDSVTKVGDEAFYDCYTLSNVYFVGTEKRWNTISIGYGNSNLLGAARHYITDSVVVQLHDTQLDISVSSQTAGKVVVAFYHKQTGQLECIGIYEMHLGETNITIDTAALGMEEYRAKVMMADSAYIPVGDAAEIRTQ